MLKKKELKAKLQVAYADRDSWIAAYKTLYLTQTTTEGLLNEFRLKLIDERELTLDKLRRYEKQIKEMADEHGAKLEAALSDVDFGKKAINNLNRQIAELTIARDAVTADALESDEEMEEITNTLVERNQRIRLLEEAVVELVKQVYHPDMVADELKDIGIAYQAKPVKPNCKSIVRAVCIGSGPGQCPAGTCQREQDLPF